MKNTPSSSTSSSPTSSSSTSASGDLVVWSHLRWGFVFQRPQHVMVRFAKTHRVFFVEEPVRDLGEADAPRLEMRSEDSGVRVVVPHLPAHVDDEPRVLADLFAAFYAEQGITAPIAWYYTPMFLTSTRALPASVVVYDCMDELSAFQGAPRILTKLEDELFARADVVFTGGRSLYESKRTRHANVHLFASSVDVPHFAHARDAQDDPEDQAAIPHPRLGFYGVIDERMDVELLGKLADLRPDWHIVLLGPIVKIDPATVPQRPNIHLLGMKKYDELPRYLSGWDTALLPFAINESTRFISPTKTPEYMAGGRPVVSTPIRDVVSPYGDKGLVHIASDAEGFVAAIERIQAEDPAERRKAHDAFLATMSWDRTVDGMHEAIVKANKKARVA